MKSTKDQNHAVEKELAQLKNEKDKIEEKLDQAKKAMLQQLQSLKNNNEKISKEKSEVSNFKCFHSSIFDILLNVLSLK